MHKKRFICVENNRGVGAKSTTSLCSPAAVCTLGSKVPKRHKPVSKYTKHMTNYTFYCARVLISVLRSIYLSLSKGENSLTRRLERGLAL